MKFRSNLFNPAGTASSQKEILGSSLIFSFFWKTDKHVLNVFGYSYNSIEKNREYSLSDKNWISWKLNLTPYARQANVVFVVCWPASIFLILA